MSHFFSQKNTWLVGITLFVLVLFFVSAKTQAAFNPTINYQGKLTDDTGATVADGTYNMRFWLLSSPSIATTSALWSESLTGSDRVEVVNGLFSIMLGSTTPLTSVDFNQTLYLGVEIGGTGGSPSWDGEMSPRKILGAVPAAFEAEHAADADTVGGVASTSFLRSDQADTATGLLTFTNGFISQASSTIFGLTTLTATTTNLVVNGERFTDLTGTGLQNSGNILSIDTTYLNTLYASTSAFNTSAELAAILTDETGTAGSVVFSASPTFTGTVNAAAATFSSTLTLSGTSANIALGSNYLSGDGDDEGVFVASDGDVGIGTTTPNQALTIFRNAADAAIEFSTASGANEKWTIGIDDSDGAKFKISSSSALGTSDRFVIDGAGEVGINTVNPAKRLHVNGDGLFGVGGDYTNSANITTPLMTFSANQNSTGGVTMRNSSTGSSADFRFALEDTGSRYMAFAMPGTGYSGTLFGINRNTAGFLFTNGPSNDGRILALGTVQDDDVLFASDNVERMRILSTGEVGIGTSTPSSKLTVQGDAYIGGNITATGTLAVAGAATLSSTLNVTGHTTLTTASTTAVTATTFYGALVGNASTATTLAANGANCSAGSAPLGVDASGAVESCFDVWTEAENTAAAYLNADAIDTSAELAAIIGDETGSGSLVFSASPTFTGNTTLANASTTNLTVSGNSYLGTALASSLRLTGAFFDSANATGTQGMVLQSTGTSTRWVATSTLGISGGGSSLFTDGGGTTYLTSLTDNLAIGTTTSPARLSIQSTSTNDILNLFETSGAEVFTVLENGNVGIGSSTPSEVLTVDGDIMTTGITGFGAASGTFELTAGGEGRDLVLRASDAGDEFFGGDVNIYGGDQGGSGFGSGSINLRPGLGDLPDATGNVDIYNVVDAVVAFRVSGFHGRTSIGTTTASARLTVQSDGEDVLNLFGSTGTEVFTVLNNGNVGIGISTPTQLLHVNGGMRLAGAFMDSTNASGTANQILRSTGTSTQWVATSTLGFFTSSNIDTCSELAAILTGQTTGTCGSVVLSAGPTFTGNTTLANASTTNLTVSGNSYLGTALASSLRLTGAFFDSTNASGTLGMVLQSTGTSTRWVATSTLGITGGSSFSDSAGLAAALSDETGTGRAVFSASPAFSGTATFSALTATGTATFSTVDINGGAIDGTTIGAASASSIIGTTIQANTGFLPDSDGGAYLGQGTQAFSGLFLDTGATINFDNGNSVLTHSSGILTVSTGDLRVTTAGTNAASVVTVGGTQTLTSKTLTAPTISAATLSGITTFSSLTASRALFTDASSQATTTALSAALLASLTDETGTGALVFGTSPTFAGTPIFGGGEVNFSVDTNFVIPNNSATAFTFATSSTASPLFTIDTTSGSENVTLGPGSGDIIIGDVGATTNLVFEEDATIHGQGGNTLTFGQSGDIINFAVNTGFNEVAPSERLHVGGGLRLEGAFKDSANATGTLGMVLQSTGTSTRWVATSTLGITGGGGGLASTDIDTCSELAAILTGNTTGTCGTFVLSASPTFTGTVGTAALTATGNISSDSDIFTTGAGDDLWLGNATQGNANFQAYATGEVRIDADSTSLILGEGQNATLQYDGTNLLINPRAVGSGHTLFSAGNVGIGTSTPQARLDVWGDAHILGNLATPTTAGAWDPNDGNVMFAASSVAVSGNYAYVTGDASNNLAIVDISDPTAPVTVGNWDPNDTNVMYNAHSVAVSGNYAYVAGYFSNNLAIVDISDPTAPVTVGNWDPNDANVMNSAFSVAVSGNYAYVAGNGSSNLAIVDISDPTAPVTVGNWDPNDNNVMFAAHSVAVSGNYAYVAGVSSDNLAIVDISDPTAPVTVGNWDPNDTNVMDAARSVAVSGNYAYVAGGSSDNLAIVDISDPAAPSTVGAWDPNNTNVMDGAFSVAVSGNYAYVTGDGSDNLAIVDISNPAAPSTVGNWDPNDTSVMNSARSVAVSGNYAYVAGYFSNNLAIVDIAGLTVSNMFAGSALIDLLRTKQTALFDQGAHIRGGLNVGQNALINGALTIQGTASSSLLSSNTNPALIVGSGRVGIGTSTPSQLLHVAGSMRLEDFLYDSDNSAGTAGMVLQSTATGTRWVATSTLGITGGGSSLFTDGGATTYLTSTSDDLAIGTTTSPSSARLSIQSSGTDDILNLFETGGTEVFTVLENGNVGIGTSTPGSLLAMGRTTGLTGSIVAGIHQYLDFDNATLNAVYYGDNTYIVNAPTATSTLVGKMLRIEDSTALGNTVRGLEVQAHRGTNTLGENTGISGFGRTFGVRGTTEGDAGGTFQPAGVFAQTRGTTQGNAIRAYSGSITTEDLVSLFQDTSAFTGTGLVMNFGNSGGSFSSTTSKFVDFQNAGTSKFTVTAHGTTTIGDGTTNNMAGLQIGYGGLCVDNDGSCTASTTGRITSVSSAVGNSDLAEMYFGADDLEPGEIIATAGILSIEKAHHGNAENIIGVVSTKPGLTLGFDDSSLIDGQTGYPVALKGRVPIKLSTENGPIKAGDKIMLSSIPGIGMKATEAGTIVGTALEDFDGEYAYSAGFIDQFGNDIAQPDTTPDSVETDERIHDGCYFGGGGALGEEEEECTPRDTERFASVEVAISDESEEMQEALMELGREEAEEMETPDGKEVKVGQALLFVSLGSYQTLAQTNVLNDLTSTSTDLVLDGDGEETLWDRVKTLAQNFVDGVLSVAGLRAENVYVENELCVDGVCVTADDLRALLINANQPHNGSGSGAPPPPIEETPPEEGETGEEQTEGEEEPQQTTEAPPQEEQPQETPAEEPEDTTQEEPEVVQEPQMEEPEVETEEVTETLEPAPSV